MAGRWKTTGTAQLSIETRGVARTHRALMAVSRRGADARPAWPMVLDMLQGQAQRRFTTEGRDAGWEPVAGTTVARDVRTNRDPRLMRTTGKLERALTADRARGGVRRRGKTQLRFGTSLPYAVFHQEGRGVPKRILVEMDAMTQARAARMLERYMAHGEAGGTVTVLSSLSNEE